jgi:hypothetical protein
MRQGRVVKVSSVSDVVQEYIQEAQSTSYVDLSRHPNSVGSAVGAMRSIELYDANEAPASAFPAGSRMIIKLRLFSNSPIHGPKITMGFNNWRGERAFAVATFLGDSEVDVVDGETVVSTTFELAQLIPGKYSIDVGFCEASGPFLHAVYAAIAFEVTENGYLNMASQYFNDMGHVMTRSHWQIEPVDGAVMGYERTLR